VPLRHIRDIHYLRPRLPRDPLGEWTVRNYEWKKKDAAMVQNLSTLEVSENNPTADIELLVHMLKVGMKFMEE